MGDGGMVGEGRGVGIREDEGGEARGCLMELYMMSSGI